MIGPDMLAKGLVRQAWDAASARGHGWAGALFGVAKIDHGWNFSAETCRVYTQKQYDEVKTVPVNLQEYKIRWNAGPALQKWYAKHFDSPSRVGGTGAGWFKQPGGLKNLGGAGVF